MPGSYVVWYSLPPWKMHYHAHPRHICPAEQHIKLVITCFKELDYPCIDAWHPFQNTLQLHNAWNAQPTTSNLVSSGLDIRSRLSEAFWLSMQVLSYIKA